MALDRLDESAMNDKVIYLHGFNSASVDGDGGLISTKNKLQVLFRLCRETGLEFIAPNLDYQNPGAVVEQLFGLATGTGAGKDTPPHHTTFIGTSLGGFMAEYMAMKTRTQAIMINPAICPSASLTSAIGEIRNYVSNEKYRWTKDNCNAFRPLEQELNQYTETNSIPRTVFLDLGDEVLDARETVKKYEGEAAIFVFQDGSHRFDHMQESLPAIRDVLTAGCVFQQR
jgi:predicted esterase YcpF (UPF0227 family)